MDTSDDFDLPLACEECGDEMLLTEPDFPDFDLGPVCLTCDADIAGAYLSWLAFRDDDDYLPPDAESG